MKIEQTECSETSEYKIQTPGNHPKESIQHSGHGESLKARIMKTFSVGDELFHVDGETDRQDEGRRDMTEADSRFSQICKRA